MPVAGRVPLVATGRRPRHQGVVRGSGADGRVAVELVLVAGTELAGVNDGIDGGGGHRTAALHDELACRP